jgi:hypothetical protein
LVIAAPLLLVQLLNDRWAVWDIHFHYGAVLVPLIAMASALALGRLRTRSPDLVRYGPWVWLSASAVYFVGWTVGPTLFHETGPLRFVDRAARWQAIATVDADSSVCAQQDLAPHLADRPVIHSWPQCDDDDRYIVLDATGMRIDPSARALIQADIERLRVDPGMRVLFDRDGAFVAERVR